MTHPGRSAMRVAEIMTLDPWSVDVEATMDAALALMDRHDVRHLPVVEQAVVEQGRLVGVLSDRDLLAATGWLPARVHAARGPLGEERIPASVREIASSPPVTIGPEADVRRAAVEFLVRRIGCLPVLDGPELVGIVTETDLLRAYTLLFDSGRLPTSLDPPVSQRMSERPVTLDGSASLAEAHEGMRAQGVRHLPILENGVLAGILSDRDLRRAQGRGLRPDRTVDQIMVRGPRTIDVAGTLSQAARTLARLKIGALPVLDGTALVGILSLSDVLDHCLVVMAPPGEVPTRATGA